MDNITEYSIFLHIIEGIGFNEKNEDIILHATLNGVKLEVEGHHTETATVFNSNCIWECMFDDLKRMKTDNRPIKIECFCKTRKNDKDVKKAIGFVLLPIRSLQVVKSIRNVQIKLHWHKLCGLASDWRLAKPELYLSALVTTKVIMESGQLEDILETKPVDSEDSLYIRPSETSLMLKTQLGIYIKLLEDECLLQVGNGPNDCDTFIVTLLLKSAKNLDQLVGPCDSENPAFRFHYDFLGGPSDLILVANSDGIYNIHEKISVNFKTSLESLRDYFKRVFYIPIDLYYNDSIIGNYKFTCVDLLPSTLEAFNDDDLWEVKSSFTIQTVFDVFESSARPTVEYTFSLNYVSTSISAVSQARTPDYIDKRARGDMGDANNFFELLPTTETNHHVVEEEPEARCVTHRIEQGKEKVVTKQCKADNSVSCRQEKEQPPLVNDMAYEVIAELEDWKAQQIDDFLVELKRKEINHLGKLSVEWDRQKKEIAQKLQEKLDECSRLTESLEAAQAVVRDKSARQYEEERGFEKMKHELDKRYTVRFMEIEEKARRIKDDMEYELKVQELRFKELQMAKAREDEENSKLRAKVVQLKEELEDMRMNTLPREQLNGLFEDLRHQSERYTELEKSKRFYKEQWAKLAKEVHRLKLHALKIQEEKLKQSNCLGLDNIMDLQSMILQERTALLTDRSELKTIKDALTSESDVSTSNCES